MKDCKLSIHCRIQLKEVTGKMKGFCWGSFQEAMYMYIALLISIIM